MPIKVLPKHVAELIAAGEVVERPASVIKELVENSIDAGATRITVEIRGGGIAYMRITDDGCGMPFDEVPTAFMRHATSKVWEEDDLIGVETLGFRGEALASVAAVARVDLLTAQTDGDGTAYSINGGEQAVYDRSGCPKGTTVMVRDLFYNVPARLKFLKKDSSEATAIAGVMDRIALSHPEIAFKLINEGKTVMQTQGGDLSSAIYSVYGREFRAGLIPLDAASGSIRVHGFICKPEASRKSRGMQMMFINNRYVNSKTVRAAVEQAYKGSIMVGAFPSFVLFIEMRASEVDVNVHPAKLECRFTYEKPVFDAVYYAVKSALNNGYERSEIRLGSSKQRIAAPSAQAAVQIKLDTLTQSGADYVRHTAPSPRATDEKSSCEPKGRAVPDMFSAKQGFSVSEIESLKAMPIRLCERDCEPTERAERQPQLDLSQLEQTAELDTAVGGFVSAASAAEQGDAYISKPEMQAESECDLPDVRFIGEAFSTYAIVEMGSDLIIIDKHAAHERIIYERLKNGSEISSQMLLTPETVTLSKEELDAVTDNIDKINGMGFEIESFGGSSLIVRALPSPLTDCSAAELVTELAAGFLSHKNEAELDRLDWLYHNMACRAAVKGGDKSGAEALTLLARQVALSNEIRYCPHGRPVAYKLSRKELEKQFGRLG